MHLLLILAIVIVGILATYAWRLNQQVKAQQQLQADRTADLIRQVTKQRLENNRSIQIIAQGYIQNQVTATEAAIRIRGLLGLLEVEKTIQEEFKAFYLLAEATQHIPILDAWQELPQIEQRNFEQQRLELETVHREFIDDAAKRIVGRDF